MSQHHINPCQTGRGTATRSAAVYTENYTQNTTNDLSAWSKRSQNTAPSPPSGQRRYSTQVTQLHTLLDERNSHRFTRFVESFSLQGFQKISASFFRPGGRLTRTAQARSNQKALKRLLSIPTHHTVAPAAAAPSIKFSVLVGGRSVAFRCKRLNCWKKTHVSLDDDETNRENGEGTIGETHGDGVWGDEAKHQ